MPSATRAPPVRQIDRQFDLSAIGKLQISQADAKPAFSAAAALNHVARADREPAGETVCKRTHEYPPGSNSTGWNFPAPMSKHRDGSETARQLAKISVNRCGQGAVTRTRCAQDSDAELGSSRGRSILPMPHASRPMTRHPEAGAKASALTAIKDRSRCPAPTP
jgi:hypothetical protein